MNSLFYTYLKLYPGKADVIMNAIREGEEHAHALGYTEESDIQECVEYAILDAL